MIDVKIFEEALAGVSELSGVRRIAAEKTLPCPFAVVRSTSIKEIQALDGGTGMWNVTMALLLAADNCGQLASVSSRCANALRSAEGTVRDGVWYGCVEVSMGEPELVEESILKFTRCLTVTAVAEVRGDGPADL